MHGYLSADIICSEKRTVFRERFSRKTVSYEEQTMSKEKYPSIFSPQMATIVVIILQIFFRNARSFENWGIYNNYSMSPSWIWSDKITNERVARVGYNHFISNKGEWNNCFSEFSNRVLPPIFISTILQSVRKEKLAHYFPYDVKLGLLAHSRSFLANQKARNAIVGAENLLKIDK